MILFAFDITFRSGRFVTLFFYDTRIETALIRAPLEAQRQYGSESADIVDISPSDRFF
jgi:hypothetical protein